MLALKIIGCIVLFFAFILSLRAKITVEYNGEVALYVRVLFIKIKILPKKNKKSGPHSMSEKKARRIREKLRKKALKKKQKKEQKKLEKEQEKDSPKQKKSISEILDVIRLIKDIVSVVVKRFLGHLRIDLARFKINVATGDAASTAIAYGAINEAVLLIFPMLDKLKGFDVPKSKDIAITADYLSDTTTADIKLSFSIRVWHVLHIAIGALGVFIRHLVKTKVKE